MEIGKKPSNIIFLDRDKFIFYSEEQNKVYTFDLRQFAANLEIIDPSSLGEQIKSFIQNYKITPASFIVVLADGVLFVKGLAPGQNIDSEQEIIQKFSESIPFEHIQIKTYTIEGGKLIVGTNKNYYQEIINSFEKAGFINTLVVPIYSTGIIIDPGQSFNEASAKIILKNYPDLIQYSLEAAEVQKKTNVEKEPTTKQAPNNKRLYLLGGIFALLIVVLIIVAFNSLNSPAPAPKKQTQISSNIAGNPTITPQQSQASLSAQLTAANIRVKISGPNINLPSIKNLQKNMTDSGFENVVVEQNQTLLSPSILYSVSIPVNLRTRIATLVAQVSNNFLTGENQDPNADVVIFLNQ